MLKVVFESSRCKACELCIEACPQDIIRLSDGINPQGYQPAECFDQDKCTSCQACAIICPDQVITVFRLVKPRAKAG